MQHFRTVLGEISESELGVVLAHEHICCYFEYFYNMLQSDYLDKEKLIHKSAEHLLYMKDKYDLATIIDCTPVNIGRDIDLLKQVSKRSGINIICSSGFYYTEEIVLRDVSEEFISKAVLLDIQKSNAGSIKFAVEDKEMNPLSGKIFSALCTVQKESGLPFVIHTNGKNENGRMVLEEVLAKGVKSSAVTIGHLSDSDDMDYVTEILKSGCYVGFDRIYNSAVSGYFEQKAKDIYTLCERGFAEKIILSHDGLVFNGFHTGAAIREDNPYTPIFDHLIPAMLQIGFTESEIQKFFTSNVKNMLKCR